MLGSMIINTSYMGVSQRLSTTIGVWPSQVHATFVPVQALSSIGCAPSGRSVMDF